MGTLFQIHFALHPTPNSKQSTWSRLFGGTWEVAKTPASASKENFTSPDIEISAWYCSNSEKCPKIYSVHLIRHDHWVLVGVGQNWVPTTGLVWYWHKTSHTSWGLDLDLCPHHLNLLHHWLQYHTSGLEHLKLASLAKSENDPWDCRITWYWPSLSPSAYPYIPIPHI